MCMDNPSMSMLPTNGFLLNFSTHNYVPCFPSEEEKLSKSIV